MKVVIIVLMTIKMQKMRNGHRETLSIIWPLALTKEVIEEITNSPMKFIESLIAGQTATEIEIPFYVVWPSQRRGMETEGFHRVALRLSIKIAVSNAFKTLLFIIFILSFCVVVALLSPPGNSFLVQNSYNFYNHRQTSQQVAGLLVLKLSRHWSCLESQQLSSTNVETIK